MANSPKRHRSFASKTQGKKVAPITFDLYDETFTAHPALQGVVILEYVAALSEAEEDNGAEAASMLLDFFEKALVPESFERFNKLTHDPETIVETELLSEIVGWLMEQYTDRPTEAS